MSYVLALLGFVALIVLHEAGHFAAAKAVGMRVERFSLFFPPLVAKVRRGETEYGIGAIPLGGYVKITGMSPHEDIPPSVVHRAYYNQAVWKRVVVILAGPAVNVLVAFFVLFGISLSIGQQKGLTSHGQPVYSRQLAAVAPPASGVLAPGDTIVAVDGHRTATVPQIEQAVASHRCAGAPRSGCRARTPVALQVQRGRALRTVSVTPRYDAASKAMHIGVEFPQRTVVTPLGIGGAASSSADYMWYVTHTTVSRVVQIFKSQDRKQFHSVVGAYRATQQDFSQNTTNALGILALISLSLAVINLFPFLPLDGGHVFWAVAEKVRGRRIPFVVMERAGLIGFALVAVVFVIGLSNDIHQLGGPGLGH
ncbi:MAG: site-2 protease family protein [Solirubrobacterales bacterium]|nr:site-2 protease family protein [Solirubrobacterales bacterium]